MSVCYSGPSHMAGEMSLRFERFLWVPAFLADKCADQLSITATKHLRKVSVKEGFVLDPVQGFRFGKEMEAQKAWVTYSMGDLLNGFQISRQRASLGS